MTELPSRMLEDVLDALRDVMPPREALLTVGRLLAWQALGKHPGMPAELAPRTVDDGLASEDLPEIYRQLASTESLGALRSAFATPADQQRDVPYEALSTHALAVISRTALALVMLDRAERRELADAWADDWFSESPRGFIHVPLEVADLVVRSMKLSRDEYLQCPGGNPDSLAIAAMRAGLRPIIVSPATPIAAAIYGAITDSEFRFLRLDPLGPQSSDLQFPDQVNACASMPIWGERLDALSKLAKHPSRFAVRTSEALGLELVVLGHFQDAAVLLPNGILSGRGPEAALRQEIVENGPLSAVISFPAGLLSGSSLPFSVLLLSKRNVSDSVVMCRVDEKAHVSGRGKLRSRDRRLNDVNKVVRLLGRPEEPFSRRVPRREIAEQDFVLVPERYFGRSAPIFSDAWNMTPLGELVTIVKPQFLKPDERPQGVEIQEAIPSEMPTYGYLSRVERTKRVDGKLLRARDKQVLMDGDVLLSTKGTIGTVAIARPDASCNIPLLPSQASVILRLKPKVQIKDPRFLVMYLRSPAAKQAIVALATGGTIQNIALDDLRALPVWVPDAETQARVVAVFDAQAEMETQIKSLKARQAEVGDLLWQETGLAEAV